MFKLIFNLIIIIGTCLKSVCTEEIDYKYLKKAVEDKSIIPSRLLPSTDLTKPGKLNLAHLRAMIAYEMNKLKSFVLLTLDEIPLYNETDLSRYRHCSIKITSIDVQMMNIPLTGEKDDRYCYSEDFFSHDEDRVFLLTPAMIESTQYGIKVWLSLLNKILSTRTCMIELHTKYGYDGQKEQSICKVELAHYLGKPTTNNDKYIIYEIHGYYLRFHKKDIGNKNIYYHQINILTLRKKTKYWRPIFYFLDGELKASLMAEGLCELVSQSVRSQGFKVT